MNSDSRSAAGAVDPEAPQRGDPLAGSASGEAPLASEVGLRPPQQVRSRQTLERIVQAALELAREGGAEAVTVQRVVKRSGSSVGSFYARFRGKDDLLAHLEERIWEEATQRWQRARSGVDWAALDLEGRIRHAVALLVDAERGRGADLRLLDAARRRRHAAYEAFRTQVLESLVGDLEAVVAEAERAPGREGDEVPSGKTRLRLALMAARGVVEQVGPELAELQDRDALVAALSDLLFRYLAAPGQAASASGGDVELFDIWG